MQKIDKFFYDGLTFTRQKENFTEICNSEFDYETFVFPATSDEKVMVNVKLKSCYPKDLLEINELKEVYAYYDKLERVHLFGESEIEESTTISSSSSSDNSNSQKQKGEKTKREEPNVALIDDTYYVKGYEAVEVDLYNGELAYYDLENDELSKFNFRGLQQLRRGHREKTKDVLFNCIEGKTLFLSFNSGNKYILDTLQKIVRAFEKWIKRKYADNLKFAVLVYEPNPDGSWHFHALITFNTVPADFDKVFADWADKYNSKRGIKDQTNVQLLQTKNDVRLTWLYLDATSEKKKDYAVFYPPRFKNIVIFGERISVPSIKVTGETLQAFISETNAEQIDGQTMIVSDTQTGEVLYEYGEWWFTVDKSVLRDLVTKTIMDAIMCDNEDILTFSLSRIAENGGAGGTPATIPFARQGESSIVPTVPPYQLLASKGA